MQEVDAILRNVCGRHTVYAREILDPLRAMLGAAGAVHVLESHVCRCEGVEYLHFRDFLNPLLDLRNALKEDA